jgi:hypothetical protein
MTRRLPGCPRPLIGWLAGLMIASLAALGALLLPADSLAVSEEVRNLLRELWIQVPSREVTAPAISLPDVNGTLVRLAEHKGRAVMIYFWTTY